jgi:acylphosphatase
MQRLHVVVRGRVQGVGFRYFVLRRARALGLTGWVRNRRDGAVEVQGEGDRAALEELLERLRQGPPGAIVADVEATWSQGGALHDEFDVTG